MASREIQMVLNPGKWLKCFDATKKGRCRNSSIDCWLVRREKEKEGINV